MARRERIGVFMAVAALIALVSVPAAGQKSGGVLHIAHRDTPASMSVLRGHDIRRRPDDGGI